MRFAGAPGRFLAGLLTACLAVLALSSCARMVDGRAVSVFADPFRVGGMPAVDGPTGLRPDAPPPSRVVEGTDGGRVDELAAQSISDLEAFWETSYSNTFDGEFTPVKALISWDPAQPQGEFCGDSTFQLVNAAFCHLDDTIGWDRRILLPQLRSAYGDMAITMVLAHEYGHAIAGAAGITKPHGTPTLVAEQQADCLAGVYLRWVAQGDSPRFTLDTGDGLNSVLAAMLTLRDPLLASDEHLSDEHGSAFERIAAFQSGFTDGAESCKAMDAKEIKERRGKLPVKLEWNQTGEVAVDEHSVQLVVDAMTTLYTPTNPPQLTFDTSAASSCDDARPSPPVSYCPATNTITVDLPALQKMGTPAHDEDLTALSGDNTAYSVLVSRYMQAVQVEHGGLVLDNAAAALRTACLTGVADRRLFDGVHNADGSSLELTAGDLDEAVAGLLTNGLAAGDVNGESVPSGFSRIDAYRTGVLGDFDRCLQRFP